MQSDSEHERNRTAILATAPATQMTPKQKASSYSLEAFITPGTGLSFQAVSRQVLSLLTVFTVVFGMGTGVFRSHWHQEPFRVAAPDAVLSPGSGELSPVPWKLHIEVDLWRSFIAKNRVNRDCGIAF